MQCCFQIYFLLHTPKTMYTTLSKAQRDDVKKWYPFGVLFKNIWSPKNLGTLRSWLYPLLFLIKRLLPCPLSNYLGYIWPLICWIIFLCGPKHSKFVDGHKIESKMIILGQNDHFCSLFCPVCKLGQKSYPCSVLELLRSRISILWTKKVKFNIMWTTFNGMGIGRNILR